MNREGPKTRRQFKQAETMWDICFFLLRVFRRAIAPSRRILL
jgi:hypothetical protein